YQAKFVIQAPVEQFADRIPSTVGGVESIDAGSCLLSVGSNSLDDLLMHTGSLGYDFTIQHPPALIERSQLLAARLTAAATGQQA
ncbi:MAG: hypothetical protein QOH03_3882, partial [Kribbellaceae bacterium]|nr:hypothetical protein [Kribbellaceae bacterium]